MCLLHKISQGRARVDKLKCGNKAWEGAPNLYRYIELIFRRTELIELDFYSNVVVTNVIFVVCLKSDAGTSDLKEAHNFPIQLICHGHCSRPTLCEPIC